MPSPFSRSLFAFLRDLRENNDRDWFKANKARYESDVREPAIQFILEVGERLPAISPHFRADPRKQGGSLFRIHRDVRFSKDKSPYKTHTGIQFRHERGKDVHTPGYYLHLDPAGCFLGVGIWHPASDTLKAIRDAIVDDPEGWRAAVGNEAFASDFDLTGDSLKRAPRGYDADHALIEDLKRKDFIAVRSLTQKDIVAGDFVDRFIDHCKVATPFSRWLCGAVGVPF